MRGLYGYASVDGKVHVTEIQDRLEAERLGQMAANATGVQVYITGPMEAVLPVPE